MKGLSLSMTLMRIATGQIEYVLSPPGRGHAGYQQSAAYTHTRNKYDKVLIGSLSVFAQVHMIYLGLNSAHLG